jgi:hypothetical protein
VLLRQVELALLLKTRASVVVTQGLELGPVLGDLLRKAALRRNGAGPTSGLLVLRAGRRRVGNLTPLECLMEAVELWKDEFAVAVVLGACGLRLRVCARIGSSAAACTSRRRLGLCCCRLIGAVVVL